MTGRYGLRGTGVLAHAQCSTGEQDGGDENEADSLFRAVSELLLQSRLGTVLSHRRD